MKSFATALSLLAATASAHTTFQSLWVDGVAQGKMETSNIRHNWADGESNFPIKDVTSPDVACNKWGSTPAGKKVSVKAGATVTAEWHHEPTLRSGDGDEPIASSHKGPVMAYLGKVDDASTASPAGVKWFKIYEDGLDSSGKWGVDRFIANKGQIQFKIPECVAPGDYFLRNEIIALHEADRADSTQLYMECAQITVTGGGSLAPDTVSFPGAYVQNGPGISYNLYGSPLAAYTPPGPRPVTCGAGNSGGSAPAPSSSAAPAPTTSKAPVPTTSQAPVPTTSSKPATLPPVVSSYAPPASSAAPTTFQTTTVKAVTTTTSKAATAPTSAPAPSGGAYSPSRQDIEDFFKSITTLYQQWEAGFTQ